MQTTDDQVLERLQGHLKPPLSKEQPGVEIDNIIAAHNSIIESLSEDSEIPVNLETLCTFYGQILKGLELDKGVYPCNLRQHFVVGGSYRGACLGKVAIPG